MYIVAVGSQNGNSVASAAALPENRSFSTARRWKDSSSRRLCRASRTRKFMKRKLLKTLRSLLYCSIAIALILAWLGLLNIVIKHGHVAVGAGTSNASDRTPPPPSTQASSTPPESADQVQQMYQVGEYSRLYGERQRSLLAIDAANPNLEAVKRAKNDWKRAGDWDQGFQRMQETLKTSLDPAPVPAMPAFQLPPVQLPAVQVPAFQAPAFQAPAFQAPAFRTPAFQAPAFRTPAFQSPTFRSCCAAP